MRVVIDASAIHLQSGGAGRYVRELVRHLPAAGVDPELLTRRNDRTGWEGAASAIPCAPSRRPLRLLWEQVRLDAALPPGTEVLHSPHYTMPLRRPGTVKRVVTIHDLTYYTHGHTHTTAKRLFFRRAIAYAALHADALICISQTTADLMRDLVRVRVPVHVVAHGVDHDHFTPDPGDGDQEVLRRLRIAGPYVLHLGAIEPRKNVPLLVAAYERVVESVPGADLSLVLAGRAWRGVEIAEPRVGRMLRLGFVAESDAPVLLRHAAVVAYPSAGEGFGLPVIEALACGAPVVTTAKTVMEEIAGDAAILVPQGDIAALAAAISSAVAGSAPPRELRIARAQQFTWSESARGHIEVYRSVLDR